MPENTPDARDNLPNLNGLRAFDAICRTGTVSAAAAALGVTPGAVSRQLSQLESTLDRLLFARKAGRLALTSEGEAYAREIGLAFDMIGKATHDLVAGRDNDRLVISCSPSFHLCWLLGRLPLFEARHRSVEVVVHTELTTHSNRADIDAFISVYPLPNEDQMIQTGFMANHSGPVLTPALASTLSKGEAPPFAGIRHLTLRREPDIWHEWYEEADVREAANPATAELDHMFLTIEAAKAGLGAAIAPYSYVAQDIRDGTLVAPFGFLRRKVSYFVAWPTSPTPKPTLKMFVGWLKEEGQKTPEPENSGS
ncbi:MULTISPECIES: LysR substrate-binding domain-containing protein [Kordiimonas]|jgi:DNA-binding transcriptional LysR family regulator|uniref:LysR substrate-binding domain-containing protein n=1 Tax=Kordiimonas TaxID=288021 RepID=UPI00257E7FCC|nr:LysR substrate-binding domain-containing protein [Kordiimonas sp. UBA4487]